MSTELEIVNNAILRVGESLVTAPQYAALATKASVAMNAVFATAKYEVLTTYPWRFAQGLVKPEPLTLTEAEADALYSITLGGVSEYTGDTFKLRINDDGDYYDIPLIQFSYKFAVPSDSLKIKMVTNVHGDLVQYDVIGAYIHCDELVPYIFYTKSVSETLFPINISSLVSLRMAWMTANYLGAASEMPDIRGEFLTLMRTAKNIDAQQDASRVFQSTDWLDQRLSTYKPPYEGLG